jgi:hypothetical protein
MPLKAQQPWSPIEIQRFWMGVKGKPTLQGALRQQNHLNILRPGKRTNQASLQTGGVVPHYTYGQVALQSIKLLGAHAVSHRLYLLKRHVGELCAKEPSVRIP